MMSDMKNSDARNRTTSAGNQERMPDPAGIEPDRSHSRSWTRPKVRRINAFQYTQFNFGAGHDGSPTPGFSHS